MKSGETGDRNLPTLTVDLWSMETRNFPIDRWFNILDDVEKARAGRFLQGRDRRDFVAAHVLVRYLLAARGAGRPQEIALRADSHGKPRLVSVVRERNLHFNLTHTNGLVAAAVAEGVEVGVDAEAVDRQLADVDVARAVFTAEELTSLDEAESSSRRYAFFRLWTLKEAAAKMLGTGLSTPLQGIQVLGDPPQLMLLNGDKRKTGCWHIQVEKATARHLLALAIACGGRPVAIRRRIVNAEALAATDNLTPEVTCGVDPLSTEIADCPPVQH